MKVPHISSLAGVALACASVFVASTASAQSVFVESNGFVVIEAESAELVDGWVKHAPEVSGARGDALRFTEGNSICSSPAGEAEGYPALEYHVRISQAATYRLKMNMFKQVHCVDEGSDGSSCHSGAGCTSYGVQSDGDSCNDPNRCWRTDISNDAYVSVRTAAGAGVDFVGGDDRIMKFFGGSGDKYSWSGNSSLDHKNPDYDLVPGDYVIEVRGRSRGLSVDRLVLFDKDSANEGDAKSAAESTIAAGTDPGDGTGGDSGAGTGGSDTGTGGSDASGTGSSDGADPNPGDGTTDPTDPSGGASGSESDPPAGEDAEPSTNVSDDGGCSFVPARAGTTWLSLMIFALAGLSLQRRRKTV